MHASVKFAAVGIAAAVSLAGCSLAADITTSAAYDPSDGVGSTLDGVIVQNLIVVTESAGSPAVLVGAIYNGGTEDVDVAVTLNGVREEFEVPAMDTVTLGVDDDHVAIVTDDTRGPGFLAEATIQVEGAGSVTKSVPVLDGTLAEYAPIVDALSDLD